jgi:hypothetical protein
VLKKIIDKYPKYPDLKIFINKKYEYYLDTISRFLGNQKRITAPMNLNALIKSITSKALLDRTKTIKLNEYKLILPKRGIEVQVSKLLDNGIKKEYAKIKIYHKNIYREYTSDDAYAIWEKSKTDIPGELKFFWYIQGYQPSGRPIPGIATNPNDFSQMILTELTKHGFSEQDRLSLRNFLIGSL